MVDCVLIVISYQSSHDVEALLATVSGAVGGMSWRAVIVNNDPGDDLRPAVAAHPEAVVVDTGTNLGYAGGINVALETTPPSRWTIFLNPDLRLTPSTIQTMAAAADGESRAVVPTVEDEDGVVQFSLRREPSLLGALGEALFGDHWAQRPLFLSEMIRRTDSYEAPTSVDWATGAALLVPTKVVRQVGCWDSDQFFLYSEETDYCRRLRMADVPIRFEPEAIVMHRGGGSGSSHALHALQEVNRVRYFRKWHSRPAAIVFALVVVLHNTLRARRPESRAALRALLSRRARAMLPGGVL